MADLHIEEFYKDAAMILAQLYGVFPRRTSVYVEDIAGADRPDEFGLHSKRHLACFGGMIWLAEEGWIRYVDTIGQLAIDQATLTQAAFVLLSGYQEQPLAEPDAATPSMTDSTNDARLRIDLIRATLESGTSTRIGQVVREILFTR